MEMAAAAWAFAKAAFVAVGAGTATAGQVATVIAINVAGSVALQTAASALTAPKVGSRPPGEWVADPNAGTPYAIGPRLGVAGNIIYKNTFGKDNEYKGLVTVHSGAGPIGGYLGFTADREVVTFNGEAAQGRYGGEMWMQRRLGEQPDTALTSPAAISHKLPDWTTAHRASGKAVSMWTLRMDSKFSVYPQGEPAPITTLVGIRGYDPRLDSTVPGGAGPCRWNDRSTWPVIQNGVIADLNWCLGLRENGKVVAGLGVSMAGVDLPAYMRAANIADANGWTVAAYPRQGESKAEVRAGLLQSAGALVSRKAGKISVVSRGAPKLSIMTISAADTAGPIELDTAANVLNRLNTLTPRYLSEAHDWILAPASPVTSEIYREEDRGAEKGASRDYAYVSSALQAAQLAALDIAHSREGIAGRWPLKAYCREIEAGEVFTIDEPGMLLDGQDMLCLEREYDPGSDTVYVTFVSETAGKVAWALGQTANPSPTPALSSRIDLSPPSPDAWDVIIRLPSDTAEQVPVFDLSIAVDNARAEEVVIEVGPSAAGPWTLARNVIVRDGLISVGDLDPGTQYWVALSYRSTDEGVSLRTVKGPFTAPGLVAGDAVKVGGEPASNLLVALASAAALAMSATEAVADLEAVYGDTVSAAESALAAGEAANLSVLKAGEAGDAASAANISAGIANTKAGEAGVSAAAASAAQVAAQASYQSAVLVGGNTDFAQGVDGWSGTNTYNPTAPVPASAWTWAASYEGRSGVMVAVSGSGRTMATKKLFPVSPQRKYRIRARLHVGSVGSGNSRVYVGMQMLDSDAAAVGSNSGRRYSLLNNVAYTTAQAGWIEVVSPVITGTATSLTAFEAGTAQVALLAYANLGNDANAPVVAFDEVSLEDVTESDNAAGSATAAATQAANASASAGLAGERATAAQGSATQAATRAGEALTYRDQSASSAADAAGSAVTASSASGTAVTARNDAQNARDAAQAAAATSLAQSSAASGFAASAQISANLAAQAGLGSLNKNPTFADWPAGQSLPGQMVTFGSTTVQKSAGRVSANAIQLEVEAGVTNAGVEVPYTSGSWNGRLPTASGQTSYWVIDYKIEVGRRYLGSSALRFLLADGATGATASLIVMKPLSDFHSSTGDGQIVEGSVFLPCSPNVAAPYYSGRLAFFAAVGANQHYVRYLLHKLSVRPATASEIASQIALPAIEAQLNITAAVATDALTRLSTVRFDVTGGAGGDPFQIFARADNSTSTAGLIATELNFANVVGGTIVKAMKLIGGEVFFMRPIYIDVGSRRLLVGPGGDWVLWFGPNTINAAGATRTNGYFALGTDGAVYLGSTALDGGGSTGPLFAAKGLTGSFGLGSSAEIEIAAVTVPNVPSSARATLEAFANAFGTWGAPNQNAFGTWRLTEETSAGNRVNVWTGSLDASSSGLDQGGGQYSVSASAGGIVPSGSQPLQRSGNVTYRLWATGANGQPGLGGVANFFLQIFRP